MSIPDQRRGATGFGRASAGAGSGAARSGSLAVLARVYRQTLAIAPVSGILSLLYYLFDGLFPAAVAFLSARLFGSVSGYLGGTVPRATVLASAGLLLGCYIFQQAMQLLSSVTINAGIYEKCNSYHDMRLAEKASRLPLLAYEDAGILNQLARAKDSVKREVLGQLFMMAGLFVASGIGIVSVVGVLASYSVWFVPISLLSVLPYFIAAQIRGKEFFHIKRAQAGKARRLAYLWGLFTGRRTLKEMRVMGFDGYIMDQWRKCRDEVNEELWELGRKDALSLLFCDILRVLGYGASLVLALLLALRGDISTGLFGACIAAFLAVQEQVRSFLVQLGKAPAALEFARDYYAFLDLPEENTGGQRYSGLEREIAAENVAFRYPGSGKDAVEGVSFTLKKGEKLAIVGENGSGKTTLSKLLLGLYPVREGAIRVDGRNLDELEKRDYWQRASVVAQQFVSYQLTLRENIGMSCPACIQEDERLLRALDSAGLSDLAEKLPLDSRLGPAFGGAELSGGQWQKLAIARALFRDSELLVLDEPTSALDPLIEAEVLSAFMELTRDKTAVIVSHRVGLCKRVDRVLVMKNGRVAEIGAHDELLRAGGEYARLYTEQEKWYR